MGERRHALRSVRVRVTAVAGLAVAVVLGVASLLLVQRLRANLVDQLDDSLQLEAERIAAAVEGGSSPAIDDDDRIVVVVGAEGDVLARTGDDGRPDGAADDVDDEAPDRDDDEADENEDDAAVAAAIADAGGGSLEHGGERYRVAAERYDARGDDDGVVYVATSTEDVDDSVASLRNTLAVTVPAVVALLVVVVWVVVGRTLRPVDRIRAQVAAIGLTELDRRVPVPGSGDEVARLAETMNDMLARLEHSVVRQRRFVADASHELRTPLTRMRAELEVDERDPDHADPAATRRSQLDEIAALQRLIEDLLMLARSDARATERRHLPVDLDDIVLEEARAAGGTSFDVSSVSAAQVRGDVEELRRVVRNLFDNARRHAVSHVSVALAEGDDRAVLTVDDDGPGVPPERRAAVFDRFTRLDEARTGSGHAGLGLAIVADVVDRHGGTVTVDDSPLGGARFVVTLPVT